MLRRALGLKAAQRAARTRRFFSQELVNLGILAHIDAGKTTISEDILYCANEIKVKGSIQDQNTQLDFLRQERERGITIKTAYSCFKWNNVKVNLIDTPGHVDFSNETFLSLCVSDRCVIVVDAKEGIQIQTFHLFHYIRENLPIFFFLNKMDVHETDLNYNIENLKKNLSRKSVLVTYPLYESKMLKFILDLPSMCIYWYPQGRYGQKFAYRRMALASVLQHVDCQVVRRHFAAIGVGEVGDAGEAGEPTPTDGKPTPTADEAITTERLLKVLSKETIHHALQKREELVEALCDLEPDLERKYVNNICIEYSEVRSCLAKWITLKEIFPVFAGSALNSLGVHLLLDYITSGGVALPGEHSDRGMAPSGVKAAQMGSKANDVRRNFQVGSSPMGGSHPIGGQRSGGSLPHGVATPDEATPDVAPPSLHNSSTSVGPPQEASKRPPLKERYKTVLFIFKLVSEKNGHNTFCKVLKGELAKDAKILNVRSGRTEVVKGLYKVKADRYVMINRLGTNDIGMVRGLEHVLVCDFMCEVEEPPHNADGVGVVGGPDRQVSPSRLRSTLRSRNDGAADRERKKKGEAAGQGGQEGQKGQRRWGSQAGQRSRGSPAGQLNQDRPLHDIYTHMRHEIESKELWFFLKSYKKRISRNVIVCTCAIEPKDCKKEGELKQVLRNICLEDNSIVVYTDPNRKLIIGSIGILNIEVTLDKIKSDYGIDIRTEEVEVVEREYLTGHYEETMTKEMKVNCNLSNITIGLAIREKEFVDVSRFIQNALRCDSVSQLVRSTRGGEANGGAANEEAANEEASLEEHNITAVQPNGSFQTPLKRDDSVFWTPPPNQPNCSIEVELNNSGEGLSGAVGRGDCTPQIRINANCEEGGRIDGARGWASGVKEYLHPPEEQPDEPVEEHIEEDVEEYLLNFNYEDLFQSSVRVHKNVHLYISELQRKQKKKKNFYEEILQSCIVTLKNCLASGFQTSGSIISTEVEITMLGLSDDTTVAVAKYACNDLYYRMIKRANVCVAKPISLLQIQTEESFVGIIVKDLIQQRSGTIVQITKDGDSRHLKSMKILAIAPVKLTHNYATVLRSISSGHAHCLMTFCGYSRAG
ncbi:unnamed protein product [Plasmodium vivax]|uniref:TetQ family GTPase n=3 Tax=Plasmodium vivax TaxID=5855 RepID=A0A0J9TNJ3_PLAVI|nr:tetQ family GTPase [Plasmodium vivax India VII]KMZ96741.1 tetQ family GTPase [Plasmodium vivax North Korean]CAG9472429.1 unnamed protein product [Plasmodium vivax]